MQPRNLVNMTFYFHWLTMLRKPRTCTCISSLKKPIKRNSMLRRESSYYSNTDCIIMDYTSQIRVIGMIKGI